MSVIRDRKRGISISDFPRLVLNPHTYPKPQFYLALSKIVLVREKPKQERRR